MKFEVETTLRPLRASELDAIERVPLARLPAWDLLVYNSDVSDFFFEFNPEQDIELFLTHAFLACERGALIASEEPLAQALPRRHRSGPLLPLLLRADAAGSPTPFRGVPHEPAAEVIRTTGAWRGMVTCCSCGIAGCGSQYAWVEGWQCVVLFTISGARLAAVELFPGRFREGGD